MRRLVRFFTTAFGVAVLGCLVLAGWAVWSAGAFDGPVARQLRTASVYVAPGVPLDQAAAERVVGNRRLVVAFLAPGTDLDGACAGLGNAADGTLALMLKRDGDDLKRFGCSRLPGHDTTLLGKSFVTEETIGTGVEGFAARPLDALKIAVVNYDLLVKSGAVPDGARTVEPSLPRYLVAVAALAAAVLGAVVLYVSGRRAANLALTRREHLDAESDARAALSAATAVLAQEIIDLDNRYAKESRTSVGRTYRKLVTDYAGLLTALRAAEPDVPAMTGRVEELLRRTRKLAAAPRR